MPGKRLRLRSATAFYGLSAGEPYNYFGIDNCPAMLSSFEGTMGPLLIGAAIGTPLVAATPAGRIVESFSEPERDPLRVELYENPPEISDGWLTLNDAPGLGLTLSEAAVKKFGSHVVTTIS